MVKAVANRAPDIHLAPTVIAGMVSASMTVLTEVSGLGGAVAENRQVTAAGNLHKSKGLVLPLGALKYASIRRRRSLTVETHDVVDAGIVGRRTLEDFGADFLLVEPVAALFERPLPNVKQKFL